MPRFTWRYLLAILLLVVPCHAEEFLTLERCLDLAGKNNLQLVVARETAEMSRADFAEANSAKFPTFQISGNVTGQQEQAIDTGPLLQGLPPGTAATFPDRFIIAEAIQSQVAASLSVLLTTFGRVEHQIVAAFLQAESDQQSLLTEQREVEFNVKQAFLGLLTAAESAEVARLNLRTARAHEKQTQILLDNGLVARFELIKAQQDVAQNENSLVEALKNEDLGRANLLFLLNSPEPLPARLEPLPALKIEEMELQELQVAARVNRPELTVMKTSMKAARHLLKAAKAEGRPTLSLSLTQSRQRGNGLSPADISQAMLQFQLPLYDGGVRKAKVAKARAQLRQLEAQEELLLDNIDLEVEQAWRDLLHSRNSLRTAESVLNTAEEANRMAAVRFQNGISTSLEYEDTQRTLTASRRQVVQARYQQDLAFSQLEKALGVDIPDRKLSSAVVTKAAEQLESEAQ